MEVKRMNEERIGTREGHKLVRDMIPEIIMKQGMTIEARITGDSEYELMLIRKLQEEVSEFIKDRNAEEIADIEEILRCYADHKGIEWETVEAIRKKKNDERGSFKRRIVLQKVF